MAEVHVNSLRVTGDENVGTPGEKPVGPTSWVEARAERLAAKREKEARRVARIPAETLADPSLAAAGAYQTVIHEDGSKETIFVGRP